MKGLQEKDFQNTIQDYLISTGYTKSYNNNFNRDYCIDEKALFEFLEKSQHKEMEYIKQVGGNSYKNQMMKIIDSTIADKNVIEALRNGIEIEGKHINLAYFKPATALNTSTLEQYENNILSVTDELVYSLKNNNRLDLVIFINGIPFFIMELKTEITGQSYMDAIVQFQKDRESSELLFRNSAVFFAIDTNDIYMTTKLEGSETSFIPFNRGDKHGKGNPQIEGKFATSYLWEDILQKDSLMEIIKDYNCYDEKSKRLIFPRYHQVDCIRKIKDDVMNTTSNNNYLIKHSAGSGNTYTISWLAYTLSKLFKDDKKLFNSVIIITDRKVLDKQLQDSISQIAHKNGVVKTIEHNSNELAEAFVNDTQIIVTTIQKFQFILDKVEKELKNKRFAVIVDEAHSSQSGKYGEGLRNVLNKDETSGEESDEKTQVIINNNEINTEKDEMQIETALKSKGKPSNVRFFALTATPKDETLEMFGTYDKDTNSYKPFHLYSMKQAIDEKFILDVLKNYTTYAMFYKIESMLLDNPLVDKKSAKVKIVQYINEQSIDMKVPIIIEHYITHIQGEIKGTGKSMLVTSSRKEVLLYKNEMDKYITEHELNIKTIGAFTDKVEIDGIKYDELKINGFRSEEIPEKFKSDEYQILIVADKFQTGFDEKKLVGMYVDKSLSGVTAVQTLSRLNRCCRDKEQTFILDFRNDRQTIKEAFAQHFLGAELPDEDYNFENLLMLKDSIYKSEIVTRENIKEFVSLFSGKKKDFPRINNLLNKSLQIFVCKEEKQRELFINGIKKYKSTYEFIKLIQVINDGEIKELYAYMCALIQIIDTYENKKILALSTDGFDLTKIIDFSKLGIYNESEGDIELTAIDIDSEAQKISSLRGHKNNEDLLANIIYGMSEESATKKLEIEFRPEVSEIIKEIDEIEYIRDASKNLNNSYEQVCSMITIIVDETILSKGRKYPKFKEFVKYLRNNVGIKNQFIKEIVYIIYHKYH